MTCLGGMLKSTSNSVITEAQNMIIFVREMLHFYESVEYLNFKV